MREHVAFLYELDGFESSEVRYKWQEKSHNIYTFKNKSLSHYEIDPMSRTAEESQESSGKTTL